MENFRNSLGKEPTSVVDRIIEKKFAGCTSEPQVHDMYIALIEIVLGTKKDYLTSNITSMNCEFNRVIKRIVYQSEVQCERILGGGD
jgi:hypothetical protein